MLKRWIKREVVHAVHKKDLESILKDLNLFSKLSAGDLLCDKCKIPVKIENIQCLFMDNSEIKICCNNLECGKKLLKDKDVS